MDLAVAKSWVEQKSTRIREALPNEIIEAYRAGKEKGREELLEEVVESVEKRAQEVKDTLASFHQKSLKEGIPLGWIFLKTDFFTSYYAAIVIAKEYYDADHMLDLYSKVVDIENEANQDNKPALRITFLTAAEDSKTSATLKKNLASFNWMYGGSE